MWDDEAGSRAGPPAQLVHQVGQDLAAISVDELGLRIALLEQEIERLRAEQRRKLASREAAGAFFKL